MDTVTTCIEGGTFWLCVGVQRQLLLPPVSFQCICTSLYLHSLSRLYLHCGVFALSFLCICTVVYLHCLFYIFALSFLCICTLASRWVRASSLDTCSWPWHWDSTLLHSYLPNILSFSNKKNAKYKITTYMLHRPQLISVKYTFFSFYFETDKNAKYKYTK